MSSGQGLSPELASPFVHAVEETFEKMLGCSVSAGLPIERDAPAPHDVSAVVGFGGARRGAVILSFSERTACRIVSRFAGEELDEIGPTIFDGIGEILNIVAGRAKTTLSRGAGAIDMSLPTVVSGREHEVHRLRDAPTLLIPFTTELGEFEITLVLERPPETVRVLLCDDSRVMRKLVRAALRDLAPALEFIEADNGARAREALIAAGDRFDVVVLDLHMPEIHGRDVLAELRQRPEGAKVPVVVLTSDPDVDKIVGDVIARVGGAEVTRWLSKPFAPAELLRVIREVRARGASAAETQ